MGGKAESDAGTVRMAARLDRRVRVGNAVPDFRRRVLRGNPDSDLRQMVALGITDWQLTERPSEKGATSLETAPQALDPRI